LGGREIERKKRDFEKVKVDEAFFQDVIWREERMGIFVISNS
jgi:hypothetical protein